MGIVKAGVVLRCNKAIVLKAIMAGQHNVPAQKPWYSWQRMDATQADGPLAVS